MRASRRKLVPSLKQGAIGVPGGHPSTMPLDCGYMHGEAHGRAKYYVNPDSYPGLNGFELHKEGFARQGNFQYPRTDAKPRPLARKGEPFDA